MRNSLRGIRQRSCIPFFMKSYWVQWQVQANWGSRVLVESCRMIISRSRHNKLDTTYSFFQ